MPQHYCYDVAPSSCRPNWLWRLNSERVCEQLRACVCACVCVCVRVCVCACARARVRLRASVQVPVPVFARVCSVDISQYTKSILKSNIDF